MTFGEKLQRLRKTNGLSQEQLSEKLNVSRQAISKWELGTIPDMDNILKISRFFDCSLDYLMNTLSVQGAIRFSGAAHVHVCVFLLALRPVKLRRQALPCFGHHRRLAALATLGDCSQSPSLVGLWPTS